MPQIGSIDKKVTASTTSDYAESVANGVSYRPDPVPLTAQQMNDTSIPRIPAGYSIAVSLVDIHRMHKVTKGHSVGGRLNEIKDKMFDIDGDTVTEFTCGLLEAAFCCDNLRSNDRRMNDPLTRVYLYKDGRWSKIANDVELSVVSDGRGVLNPVLFKIAVEPIKTVAPPVKVVSFGKKKT